MSASKVDVHGILERAGANPDAQEGSQAWALAQVESVVAELVEAASNASSQFVTAVRGRADMRHIRELDAALARIGSAP
jgi:hypothetical protein